MDGLTHPRDLEAWHRWQLERQPWRRRVRKLAGVLADIARPSTRPGEVVVTRGGTGPTRVLVVLDSRSTSTVSALVNPLEHLDLAGVTVLSSEPVRDLLPTWVWRESSGLVYDDLPRLAAGAPAVLSTGHYLPLGRAARDAVTDPARFVTVQHGLLTPHAPPLAEGTTLLAWSDADAAFWGAGRKDVRPTVVGSELLWEAGRHPAEPVRPDTPPVFLGQLHGAELPHALLVAAAESFCRETGAVYRPHPAERDRRSRAVHDRFEAEGISVDRTGTPVHELGAPVVGVFSTGVLEAAAAGLPAHVHCPDPPAWLTAFWDRYGLSPWGGPPTASPERPAVQPSRAVAEVVEGMMNG